MSHTLSPEKTSLAPTDESGASKSFVNRLGLDRFSGLYVWALLVIAFGILLPDTFLTENTLRSVASQQAVTALLALALLLPMAAGAFDLSVGAMLGLSMVLVTWLQSIHGWEPGAAILLALAVGAVVGLVNGLVVVKLGVSSFITTLGTSSLLTAAVLYVSDGRQITGNISQGFKDLGQGDLMGVPLPVVYVLLVGAVLYVVTELRPVGRKIYATGGNPAAAKLTGISTDRVVIGSMVASGLIAAFAGVVFAAMVGSSSPTAGPPFLLPAFAAVFLGSTQIRNGRANVIGTLIAVYVLATGVKGLLLLGVPLWVSDLFNGLVLIAAVALAVGRGQKVGTSSA